MHQEALIAIFNVCLFAVAGKFGGTSARIGAGIASGTDRSATRSSDHHEVTTTDQQGE